MVVAGRPLPVYPEAGYVAFNPADVAFWSWDFVTEQAFPRAGAAAQAFGAVRVLSPDEWRLQAAASPASEVMRAESSRQSRQRLGAARPETEV